MRYNLNLGRVIKIQVKKSTALDKISDIGWTISSKLRGTRLYRKNFGKFTVAAEINTKETKKIIENIYSRLNAGDKLYKETINKKKQIRHLWEQLQTKISDKKSKIKKSRRK